MKIMIFGFSVTVQRYGYFAKLKNMIGKDHEVYRYSVEAAQPPLMRHLIQDALDLYNPDVVIFELATGGNRALPYDAAREKDYRNSISHMVKKCQSAGAKIGFFCLPRYDVTDDWQLITDKCIADSIKAPVKYVGFNNELLADGVHTNDIGSVEYAKLCFDLIDNIVKREQKKFELNLENDFISIRLDSVLVLGGEEDNFERGGYEAKYVKFGADQYIAINFQEDLRVVGFSAIYGPESGELKMHIENKDTQTFMVHDRRCYYSRPALVAMKHVITNGLIFHQSAEIPPHIPVKGQKFHGSRVARIGHILAIRKNEI